MAPAAAAPSRRKVLIIDDSPSVGRFLERVLGREPRLEVIGQARDAFEARDMIKALSPDVLTLDVEMPRMDGLTFLRNLMRLHPLPVVMISPLTAAGGIEPLDALEAGAIDFCVRRQPVGRADFDRYAGQVAECVRAASLPRGQGGVTSVPPRDEVHASLSPTFRVLFEKVRAGRRPAHGLKRLVALGASTGGPEALRQVVGTLVPDGCALVLAQHMPARFMEAFAERLSASSALDIRTARDGEPIVAGRGYVAPGDHHLRVVRRRGELLCRLDAGATVSGHRPSVDVLFESVAQHVGHGALGALLTGMGEDGATGLCRMREAGAVTLAQDEGSSAVWGMPGRAVAIGGVDRQLPLGELGPALAGLLRQAA